MKLFKKNNKYYLFDSQGKLLIITRSKGICLKIMGSRV